MNIALRRIEGRVSELQTSMGRSAFLQTGAPMAGAATAAGLAASGLADVAVGTAMVLTGGGDDVEFFVCRIGDVPVGGAFAKVTFKDGDDLVVAAEPVPGSAAVAHAAYAAGVSTLWIEPHCSRGSVAHLWQSLKAGSWAFLAFAAVSVPLLWKASGDDPKSSDRVTFFGALFATLAAIAGGYYALRFFFQWRGVARRADAIFRCLGFVRASAVDLSRENAKWSRAHGIPWPYETNGPWIYRCDLPLRSGDGSS